MLESPLRADAPPGHARPPPPTYNIKESLRLLPPSARLLPSFRRCGNPSRTGGEPSVPAIDLRRLPLRPRPSNRISDAGDAGSVRIPAIDSRPSSLRPRPSNRISDAGSVRIPAIDSRPSSLRPRPSNRISDAGDAGSVRIPAIDSRPSSLRPRPSIGFNDAGSGRVPAADSRPSSRRSPIRVDDRTSGQKVSPVDSRPLAPRPRPSMSGRVSAMDSRRPAPQSRPVDDPGSGPLPAITSRGSVPPSRPSICVRDFGSSRVRDINSPGPAPRPGPLIRVDNPRRGCARVGSSRPPARRPSGVLGSCKPSPAANKELEEAENEIQMLNELRLGDDISYEEYLGYLKQLPEKPDVDTSTELDAIQLEALNTRHALYRIKYYQLSQQKHNDKLCSDKLKEDYPPSRLKEENFFKSYENGKLDWSFHPDCCKLAGLEDYQRLVPRNYGGYEYVRWDEYRKKFHSYEIEQEYVKYCEDLSKKLKWIEAYVPNKSPSLKWGRILTRGAYQAIKIATDFKIPGCLAFFGFHEWFDSMSFDVCACNEFDGVYYEIWQRYTNETKFRDVLDEVYELNRFPLRQDRMRCALDNDTFCSDLEEEFLACTTCLKEFTEDKAHVTEEKARGLIAEALRKEKPKFYEDYCRKKIYIARAIGLVSS